MKTPELTRKSINASEDSAELVYWVHRAEPASRKYIVLLHGGASNHTRWSEFVDTTSLTGEWNFIIPDLRGNGESMTRERLDLPTWSRDLRDTLVAEGAEMAMIFGHSLGAQIALDFAARYPSNAEGLILLDPIFQSSLKGRSLWIQKNNGFMKALVDLILGLNRLGLRRRRFYGRDLRELDEETREALRGAESFEEIAKRYGALGPILRCIPTANYLRQALASVQSPPRFETLELPVLAMLSGCTTVGDIEKNKREVAQFPQHKMVILDANHWPLTETPDAVRLAVETWLAQY